MNVESKAELSNLDIEFIIELSCDMALKGIFDTNGFLAFLSSELPSLISLRFFKSECFFFKIFL